MHVTHLPTKLLKKPGKFFKVIVLPRASETYVIIKNGELETWSYNHWVHDDG